MALPLGFEKGIWELLDVGLHTADGDAKPHYDVVLGKCLQWFHGSGASLFLVEQLGVYALQAQVGAERIPLDAVIRSGEGIAGRSIELGRPLLITDPRDEPALAGHVEAVRDELASSMVIPLFTRTSGCLGVLNISRERGSARFTSRDLLQAEAVALQIALVFDNGRLLADAQAARKKLDSVLQCLGVGVVVLDSSGLIANANPLARVLLESPIGCRVDELSERVDPALRCALEYAVRETMLGRACHQKTYAESGDLAWSLVASPMNEGGASISIEDITQHERDAAESARMKRLAEIGGMTAAIAHEIRNPLTGIRSAAQMIQEMPDQARDFAGVIEEEALKLNTICDEFLEFARPLFIRYGDVNLAEIATRLKSRHARQFEESDVELEVVDHTTGQTFKGDDVKLEQAMRNMILNALEACSPGKKVSLTVEDLAWTVEDNGSGIPNELMEKLFTPFVTTKPQGTGLGLTNVRKVVDAHGGKIQVWSELGRGSRFAVRVGAGVPA